ncbi:MAG: ubiquinol-cytochrome c reductase iron-sulfur subunit [Actinomycetia bacterium]|nr:ubiquinol-cytochrome c reductase iron-sulfur subunit [Actinomycetes bacterium]
MPNPRVPRVAFGVTILSGIGLLVVYGTGGQPQLEGLLWFYALAGLGVGIIVGANNYLPNEESEEERHPLASSEEMLAAARADFHRADGGDEALDAERRSLLRLLAGAFAAIGVAVVFPIRSLGPHPSDDLRETDFAKGVRLVTVDGAPVKSGQLGVGELLTVFPEGHTRAGDSPTLLIRYDEEEFLPAGGRASWVTDGMVAYSKICTHAACAVGLYQNVTGLLLCPCHQSTFDVNNACTPTFGPATRPLPQLPIAIDSEGFVVAQSDYPEPVGPGYWDRMNNV